MDKLKLSLGDKIEIELYDSDGERKDPVLVSQHESLLEDGSMVILAPIHAGYLYPLNRREKVGIVYEKNSGIYKFDAVVAEPRLSGLIRMIRIVPISEPIPIQRRNFFRLNIVLDAKYRIFAQKNANEVVRGEYIKAISKDLSGGGICLLTMEEPILNWYVEAKLDIDDEITFVGIIVRSTPIRSAGSIYKYEMGVEFIKIRDIDREKVISYIFSSQRKMLKKGWSTT